MSKQLGNGLKILLLAIKQRLSKVQRELITASVLGICVLLLRSFGLLQSLEWVALDQLFQLRSNETTLDYITIVAIDEPSLRKVGSWPIPDSVIAKLLQQIAYKQPRAVGLDIYRDMSVKVGHPDLVHTFESMPNLVGIELMSSNKNVSVLPPPILGKLERVGFNNVLFDADGKIRRNLLYSHFDHQVHISFSLKLALLYLKTQGITLKQSTSNPNYLQLGKAVFKRLQPHDGAYVKLDNTGYQILSNFPKVCITKSPVEGCGFRKVSMSEVLANRVPDNWFRDRIVLIGSTATSLQDFVLTPYSSRLIGTVHRVAGIELQAYFISELIEAAINGRPLLKFWSDFQEYLWIFAWSYLGSLIIGQIRKPSISVVCIIISCFILSSSAYFAFLLGWWIPIVPALLTFFGSAILITSQIAYRQEEWKRSKEFLHQVLNTISDPVFVKNEQYQWIVLNKAFCQFIGYPIGKLMEKSDYDFFPQHEADIFRVYDKLVFQTQQPLENEEAFTDAKGNTHLIATKRSLHKDAAGNSFLVGVIRDITKHKLREQELERAADELHRSNYELKKKEDHLRYLAYHDNLTGLPNRKFFDEQLEDSIQWAYSNNLLLGLLFIDLDGFKQVNDTLGHKMGDLLLVTVAQRLSNCLRGSDTVSRLGGDEFTVILRAIPNTNVAAKVSEKILATITEPIVLDGNITKVSASIGISIYPINGNNIEILMKQADISMYRAKQLGKNRYEFA
ncbi:CHASE2 domain-containing protein [Iningainema tapete]|uniref:CHASE2 domain-containing protein n=1 Tax=Iningainema tapete BLCC-T55 TaxID=2748662 RepID=A0A8J7CFC7_9CYAN|nr:CHASE2 domain-containing protein [Iningainema tapete]MBD2774675.1 CHASE2 domain-containing protein [Iningainema tapete BLCC-T55]